MNFIFSAKRVKSGNLGLHLSVQLPSYGGIQFREVSNLGGFTVDICVCMLQVCMVPSLARGPYLARHVSRARQAKMWQKFSNGSERQKKSVFSNESGRWKRKIFSNGPGRQKRKEFSNGRARPSYNKRKTNIFRVSPGRQNKHEVFKTAPKNKKIILYLI